MDTRNISNMTNFLIHDYLDGGPVSTSTPSEYQQRMIDADNKRRISKVQELYSDDSALANLSVLRVDGTIQNIFLTQKEADVIAQLICLMAVYEAEG